MKTMYRFTNSARPHFRKYLIYFLPIAFLIPLHKILPCGPGPAPEEFYIFAPSDFSAIESDQNINLESNQYCSSSIFRNSNIAQWNQYFGLPGNYMHHTDNLIYENNLNELKNALEQLKSSARTDKNNALKYAGSLSKNPVFVKAVEDYKKDALMYLLYAKENEEYANLNYNPWGPPKPVNSNAMMKMESRGLMEMDSIKDEKIKYRYSFQIIRLAHYRKDYKKAAEYFEQMKIQNISPLYYRILSLYAGALYHSGQPEKARYLFAKIASRSQDYGHTAMIDFKNIAQDEKKFNETLSFAKSDKEKIEIIKIRALTDDSATLEDLKSLRKLDSHAIELDEILIHKIALTEKRLLNRFYSRRDTYPVGKRTRKDILDILMSYAAKIINYFSNMTGISGLTAGPADHRYSDWSNEEIKSLRDLRAFVSETSEKFALRDPFLWYLSGAYLSLLDEDYKTSDFFLKSAMSVKQSSASAYLLKKQKELALMQDLMSNQPIDTARRRQYSEILNSLYGQNHVKDLWSKSHQSQMYIHRMLKRTLADQGQKSLSLLISNWSGFSLEDTNADDLNQMRLLLEKKDKDSLENYITAQSGLKPETVSIRLASRLIKENNLKKSLDLLEKYPEAPLNLAYIRTDTPFESPIQGSASPDLSKANKWNKKNFAARMLYLQKSLSRNSDSKRKAGIYQEMGNGWYNISQFGSWWIIVDDSWSSYAAKENYESLLIRAERSWIKSAELYGKNTEPGAHSLYLAVLAEQRMHDADEYQEKRNISMEEKNLWKNMKDNYSDTDFFKLTVRECSYYRQFTAGN